MTAPAGHEAEEAPRRRRGRYIVALLAVTIPIVILAVPWWGRDLAYFRVNEVEVRGVRFARPDEIVERLSIDTLTSIWIPMDTLAGRVRAHPQVDDVTIRRRLPGKLVVTVTELEPVAFLAERTGMQAYDAAGRKLPLDPSRVATDVPIVGRADSLIFALLGELKAGFPEVYARISEVQPISREQWRVQFPGVPVLIRRDVSAARFAELSSVEADLARRRIRPVELDLRFKDQVIARIP